MSTKESDNHFQIVKTADGSHSVYVGDFDEHYHSHHGALAESVHVYIRSGLEYFADRHNSSRIDVFEMGFGTGLNALLAARFATVQDMDIRYTTIEKFPIPEEVHRQLNYPDLPGMECSRLLYDKIYQASWGSEVLIHPRFRLKKIHGDFFETEWPRSEFDIVFFDAFGSRAQEDMWQEQAFSRCFDLMRPGAFLVTYASKGSARRHLEALGFLVERLPGAPGKREMMRASKPAL